MIALATVAGLLAEGATAEQKRQAIGFGVGAFIGLSLLLFLVTRLNRDR
jgi:hypothetical protein